MSNLTGSISSMNTPQLAQVLWKAQGGSGLPPPYFQSILTNFANKNTNSQGQYQWGGGGQGGDGSYGSGGSNVYTGTGGAGLS